MQFSAMSVRKAIAWRVREKFGDDLVDRTIFRLGSMWRPTLRKPSFIGIAGSVGKTTAKDLLVGILSRKGLATGNIMSLNAAPEIAKIILRMRPWHSYCVAELGESKPGSLDSSIALLKPTIAIITTVGDDHIAAFGSRSAIASEINKLVYSIPAKGTVVLNMDDERVAQMKNAVAGQVITYGTSEQVDLHAEEIESVWPEPLQFIINYKGQSRRVTTQLYGRQLLTSVLAAIGGGLAAGLSIDECIAGIAAIRPAEGRMQKINCNGLTFIRDDFKAPRWTIDPLLDQLGESPVKRRILVIGTISDTNISKELEILRIAKKALEVADIVIFVGRFALSALKAHQSGTEERLFAFNKVHDANEMIHATCHDGDLILLKGINKQDHLCRIPLSYSKPVNCWVDDCELEQFCSECSHLGKHRSTDHFTPLVLPSLIQSPLLDKTPPQVGLHDNIIIGLGNQGAEYAETPHNVGYAALDALCHSLKIAWQEYSSAWIASTKTGDKNAAEQGIWLIKVKSQMNLTGPVVKVLSDAMDFSSEQCILIYDDADLPLGKVKTRMNGSSGGHRGVASILDALQTEKIRRVKIGITTEEGKAASKIAGGVLRRFSAENWIKIQPAFQVAEKHIAELILLRDKSIKT
jgi:aminoacyl-tRNA hydrolase